MSPNEHVYYACIVGVWDLGFESCIQQKKTTCLLSIRKSFACARASKLTITNMYIFNEKAHVNLLHSVPLQPIGKFQV